MKYLALKRFSSPHFHFWLNVIFLKGTLKKAEHKKAVISEHINLGWLMFGISVQEIEL